MRVAIAGATGVLGRRMVRQFLERGHGVVGLARDEKGRQTIRRLGGEGVVGDIFDARSLAAAFGRADVVIHAATSIPTDVSGGRAAWELNDRLRREGTRALTEAAAMLGAMTYIQQSVVWVARPADDSFFEEKTALGVPGELYRSAFDGERIAAEAGARHGFNVAVLRCGGFFAARVPVVGRAKVARMLSKLLEATASFNSKSRAVELNGLYGVTIERENPPPGFAGRLATLFQLNAEGLIESIYFVMASRKLKALPAAVVAEVK